MHDKNNRRKQRKTIIIGEDFNAKMARKGGKTENEAGEELRMSYDETTNEEGKKN